MVPPHPSLSINDLGGKVSRMFHFYSLCGKKRFSRAIFSWGGFKLQQQQEFVSRVGSLTGWHSRFGNKKFHFFVTPTWGNDPIWRAFFSNGLKPPTSMTLKVRKKQPTTFISIWNLLVGVKQTLRRSGLIQFCHSFIFVTIWLKFQWIA